MSPQSSPNFTLDPQGIRGTAMARQVRRNRRRQTLQTLLVALALFAIGGALGWWITRPQEAGFVVQSARALPLDLGAPATFDGSDNLWLTASGGALWRIGAEGAPRKYGAATSAGAPPFVSASGGVYVPGLDGTLTAFAGAGKARWKRDLGGALATTPALWRAGDLAILAVGDGDSRVAGLNASDGKTLWSARVGGPVGGALTATREGLLTPTLASGAWRGGLVCLEAKTGRIKWRYPANRQAAAGVAPPLYDAANGRVYWNNDEGTVACLDAKNGRAIWQTEVANAPASVMFRATPVLFGQSLVVGGNDGVLRSLNAANGKARWSVDLGSPIRVLYAANVGGLPAVLVVGEREIVLVDASKGAIIGRDLGLMAWPISGGKGAIIVGDSGSWWRVSW